MRVRIGFVGQRADLAVEVASLAMRAGASVQTCSELAAPPGLNLEGIDGGGDLLLVDVDAVPDPSLGQVAPWPSAAAVVCRPGEVEWAVRAAEHVRCRHVVELPTAAAWLERQLLPPARSSLVGVIGVVGGVGASTVSIACAMGAEGESLLVDADPLSPGLDLPLGIVDAGGARWAQIPDAGAPLDAESLRSALPRVADCCVLTGPAASPTGWPGGPSSGQCTGVLEVGRASFERTVVDLGRRRDPRELLTPADAVALVIPASLAGVVAARSALDCLAVARVVLLVCPSPWLETSEVAAQLGVAEVVVVPRFRRAGELSDCGDLLSGRTGRGLRAFGQRVWEQLV